MDLIAAALLSTVGQRARGNAFQVAAFANRSSAASFRARTCSRCSSMHLGGRRRLFRASRLIGRGLCRKISALLLCLGFHAMAISITPKQSPRQPSQRLSRPQPSGPMSGGLLVMATLIGVTRALSNQRRGLARQAKSRQTLTRQDDRGRAADKPTEIPAKGLLDVAWRVYEGIQRDRVMLIAAGVTYYALLALFPATAALVSLYGLFADASIINEHLALLSGFLPEGALQVIGEQVQRIAAQGQGTLGAAFLATLALSLVERQRRHQGDLRCPQHHLQGTGKAQLHGIDAAGTGLHWSGALCWPSWPWLALSSSRSHSSSWASPINPEQLC